jgi:hypothetical protein
MKALIAVACIALAGCATEPMSPQEAAIVMQMLGNQQAASNAAWQNMQSNPVFQRQQPLYQAPQRSGPVRCTTRHIGGTSYTDCY